MKGITQYQLEILKTVQKVEKETKDLIDFDQLLSRLSWAPSKASTQFTIRAVISKGLLEKSGIQTRRGRNRVCYKLTENGKAVLDPRPKYVEKDSIEGILEKSTMADIEEIKDIPGLLAFS